MIMLKKYLITKGQPVLFPCELIHANMIGEKTEVESAGFFILTEDEKEHKRNVICLGESANQS